MTPTAITEVSTTSIPALTRLVTSAAASFPADGLVAGPVDSQDDLGELLPTADAFVLVADIDSTPCRQLVLAISPALLGAIGLAEADGLATALEPVIACLADEDAVALDQIRLGVGTIGLAGIPVSGGARGDTLLAAGLFLGPDHVATVGIAVSGADPDGDDHAADHDATAGALDLPDVGATRPAATADSSGSRSLDLLRNVEMNVTAELGRSKMTVADLLSLTPGSVVELDRAAGTPIDLLVNGTLIARGEVVVIDEEFGVRISEIVDRVDGI